jgi:hypothetical protein
MSAVAWSLLALWVVLVGLVLFGAGCAAIHQRRVDQLRAARDSRRHSAGTLREAGQAAEGVIPHGCS